MARPKTIDRNERPVITQQEEGKLQIELDRKISMLILRLLKAEGLSKAAFGRKINFTQANLSNVFSDSASCEQNHWSIPLIIGSAYYFGVSVGELITAAEGITEESEGDTVRVFIACRKTAERSRERLQRLIWLAEGYNPSKVKAEDRKLLELAYGVSQMEIANPVFCKQYYSGLMSDKDVLKTFEDVLSKENSPVLLDEDTPPIPLWAALQRNWKNPLL